VRSGGVLGRLLDWIRQPNGRNSKLRAKQKTFSVGMAFAGKHESCQVREKSDFVNNFILIIFVFSLVFFRWSAKLLAVESATASG